MANPNFSSPTPISYAEELLILWPWETCRPPQPPEGDPAWPTFTRLTHAHSVARRAARYVKQHTCTGAL